MCLLMMQEVENVRGGAEWNYFCVITPPPPLPSSPTMPSCLDEPPSAAAAMADSPRYDEEWKLARGRLIDSADHLPLKMVYRPIVNP